MGKGSKGGGKGQNWVQGRAGEGPTGKKERVLNAQIYRDRAITWEWERTKLEQQGFWAPGGGGGETVAASLHVATHDAPTFCLHSGTSAEISLTASWDGHAGWRGTRGGEEGVD